MEADKERQARRTHLQRAILDLRSQQASELARDLLTSDRPKVSAAETSGPASSQQDVARRPLRRAASARTARDRRPPLQWLEHEQNKDFRDMDAYLLKVRIKDVVLHRGVQVKANEPIGGYHHQSSS